MIFKNLLDEMHNKHKALMLSLDNNNTFDTKQKEQDNKINKLLSIDNNVKLLSVRTSYGDWVLSNLTINKPVFITYSKNTAVNAYYVQVVVRSGTDDNLSGSTNYQLGVGRSMCMILIPKEKQIVLTVGNIQNQSTLRAYQ